MNEKVSTLLCSSIYMGADLLYHIKVSTEISTFILHLGKERREVYR